MKKIVGKEKSLNELLARKKYTIHYYQREYRWGRKQIEELLDDLVEEFLESYEESHVRKDGANYGHYYLGSIVITSDESDRAIIDGQQRLTSLTLLLIYLENLQRKVESADRVAISDLIFSEEYGSKSFNISVDEREGCLNALFKQVPFDISGQSESVQTIYARYKDIEEIFPEDLKNKALPFFIEWLIKKVHLVEITAYTEQDAHKIFVSMNDRGLSLTATEMLKGYLLSEIKNDDSRNKANELWKEKILEIKSIDIENKEEDADFIKNWLRAQYAETIRETKKGATKEDFDLIGTEFHKWVRENAKGIGLNRSEDFEAFVLDEFKLFAETYIKLKKYSKVFHPDYEYVFYNANRNFTLQYQIILASLDRKDSSEVIDRKLKAVSCFIDQYIMIRVFNFKLVEYSTIKNAIFNLTKSLRRCDISQLGQKLQKELSNTGFTLDSIDRFYLNGFTARYMLHILARLTHFIDSSIGKPTKFEDYVNRRLKNPNDIEHIWADKFERYTAECPDADDFDSWRNKFGALLLLPRDKNRSFQDSEYETKLEKYYAENILAQSLNEKCYQNNPQFRNFIEKHQLPFKPHREFKKADIMERQLLFKMICCNIWNPEKLLSF